MEEPNYNIDERLQSWETLRSNYSWNGILIGNGASRSVWDDFKYESLYQAAKSDNLEHPLSSEDQYIFSEMQTENFEQVLAALATSEMVCDALSMQAVPIRERYESIQRALFEAVSKIHPPWKEEDGEIYSKIRSSLLPYEFVYSTNYDLILYWAIMNAEGAGFKDYFFQKEFDIWGKATKVLYLHGGIHIAKSPSGATIKRRAAEGWNLLESLETLSYDGIIPLFITEGSSKDKLSSIYRSDYLSFAYQQFAQHSGPVVVFGHSLGDSDQHLVDVMQRWGKRRIAISIYPGAHEEIIAQKAELNRKLPEAELLFFDHTSHPLGSSERKMSS